MRECDIYLCDARQLLIVQTGLIKNIRYDDGSSIVHVLCGDSCVTNWL